MAKYQRRTSEQLIADLEAKIRAVKLRAERKKARADPAIKHTLGAVKLVDKALAAASDTAMRSALQDARSTLAACTAVDGVIVPSSATEAGTVRRQRGRQRAAAPAA